MTTASLLHELNANGIQRVRILEDTSISGPINDGLEKRHRLIVAWVGVKYSVSSYRLPGYKRTWNVEPIAN